MINAALQAWSFYPEIFKPELARTTRLKANLLQQLGQTTKAKVAFKVAGRLRAELVPDDKRDIGSLEDSDFESLLLFLAR